MPGKKDRLTELPKLDEWLAPWEQDKDGNPIPEEDQEVDTTRLKKYLHGLLGDKISLRRSLDETTTQAEELERQIADAADPKKLEELQAEVTKARQERDEAKKNAEKDAAGDLKALKFEVALDKGLTKVQAKRLLGSTREELEQDAEELLASFGSTGSSGGDDGEGGETIRKGPKRKLTSAGDPDEGKGGEKDKEIDPDEWAKGYLARR